MDFCKFEYPAVTPTSTVTITSTAPQLPLNAFPVPNHTANESTDGTRQTASLGDDRKVLQINLNNLSDTEYNSLETFLVTTTGNGLLPFKYTDLIRSESWVMFVQTMRTGHKKGQRHFIQINMKEQV